MQEKDCRDNITGSIQISHRYPGTEFTVKPAVNGVIVELNGYGVLKNGGTYVFTSITGATDFIREQITGAPNVSK